MSSSSEKDTLRIRKVRAAPDQCATCGGHGDDPDERWMPCPTCGKRAKAPIEGENDGR